MHLTSASSKPISSLGVKVSGQDDHHHIISSSDEFNTIRNALDYDNTLKSWQIANNAVSRQGSLSLLNSALRGDIVPSPQATRPSVPKFGHGAIPEMTNSKSQYSGQIVHESKNWPIVDMLDNLPPSTAPRQIPSSKALAGGDLFIDQSSAKRTEDHALSTSTISLAGILTTHALTGLSTTGTASSRCTTTMMGSLSNPCPTEGGYTVHISTVTLFSNVNCHGCTAIDVVEPMWGCPLETAGVETTVSTPYTWTSTVCEPSFVVTPTTTFLRITTTATDETTVTEVMNTVAVLTVTTINKLSTPPSISSGEITTASSEILDVVTVTVSSSTWAAPTTAAVGL